MSIIFKEKLALLNTGMLDESGIQLLGIHETLRLSIIGLSCYPIIIIRFVER